MSKSITDAKYLQRDLPSPDHLNCLNRGLNGLGDFADYYSIVANMMDDLKHKDITGKIIGCAFEVHKFLGNGFRRSFISEPLLLNLSKQDLTEVREIEKSASIRDSD